MTGFTYNNSGYDQNFGFNLTTSLELGPECRLLVLPDTDLTLKAFWKEHHNIPSRISFTEKSWVSIFLRTEIRLCTGQRL